MMQKGEMLMMSKPGIVRHTVLDALRGRSQRGAWADSEISKESATYQISLIQKGSEIIKIYLL